MRARALVCSIGEHTKCDGNAPNGPAGVGSPCSCGCHSTAPPRDDGLREAAQAFVDATEDPRIWAVLIADGTSPVRLVLPGALLDAMRDARNALRAALAAAEPESAPASEHAPGEHHDYGPPTCRVCGVEGMLNLSIEPQRAPDAPDDRSALAWDDREAVARVEGISGAVSPFELDTMEDGG